MYQKIPTLFLLLFIAHNLEAGSDITFEYGPDDKPIPGVKLTQTESNGTVTIYATDSNGQITLPATSNTYTLQASLAETGSDPISVQDALYVLQHIVELRTLDADQIKAADTNGDGKITIQDALKVLQHNVELITLDQNLIFYDAQTGNLLSETTFNPSDTPSITVVKEGDANLSFKPDSITDHAPILTGNIAISIAENKTSVSSLLGSDADDDTLTYTLEGTDASYFSISDSGVLTFNSAPDYETKNSYSLTITVNDGVNTSSQGITVTVTDEDETTAFNGKAIDGYISGATIFIDQNFNFKKDTGEYFTTTDTNGAFTIDVNDADVSCLENRPIVADVPVGAEDSTLGTVSNAYQMILPSISDTGSSSIVISPFTSLFSEAILSAKSDIDEDLSVTEGCSSSGDTIATKISERIDSLKSSIQSNFGISFTDLTSDFIASSGDQVNEGAAQNIAKILPYLRQIDNQVSDSLTDTFGKPIRANVSLSESALDIIFDESSYDKLPLDFKSIYRTDANSEGWYQDEILTASGAFISDSGRLYRADCSETDTQLCSITDLSLKNISNASTSYIKSSSFYKNNVDFTDLGINSGSLYVSASDARTWRNNSANWQDKNNRDRECQTANHIRFRNSAIDGITTEIQYDTYSQGYQRADCDEVRHYYFPKIQVQNFFDNGSDSSLNLVYYINDINRSGITDDPPYDFISNRVNIDPTIMVKEIASLPRTLNEINTLRRMFNNEDYVLYQYHKDNALNAYFEIGTNPRNDMFRDEREDRDPDDYITYGQAARTAFFNRINADPQLSSEITGSSSPVNSSVLGRIANSYIEVVDYIGSDEIKIPVYPTYDATTKTLDYSITGASLDLENVQSFIENGINGKPVTVNLWYSPDDSISGTVPVKLYLYQGNDTNVDSGEGYFSIEFDLTVASSEGNEENRASRTASQIWTVPASSTITVKYIEGSTEISTNITNSDADQITLTDDLDKSDLSGYKINQPTSLDTKIQSLISAVADDIGGIQSFFTDGGTYTLKLDLASGGHSLVGYYRNTVDYITGTFTTKSTPTYPISVNDMRIEEGKTKDLCFTRPSKGDLSATSFDLSFTLRERPGKGAFQDDFSLSSSTVSFAQDETQKCVEISATTDTYFDWVHYAYLDISAPSNGQDLSRSRIKISILDSYGYQNRISWKAR